MGYGELVSLFLVSMYITKTYSYPNDHRNCSSDSCGPLAECSKVPSGCTCVSGYRIPPTYLPTNESYGCIDIDECVETSNLCGPYSNCTNKPGSYNCTCLEGFAPNNQSLPLDPSTNACKDVDECLDIHTACGDFATCTNTIGSHICTCYTGFEHNGPFNCTDIDECFNSTICGPMSICTNTPGSFNCTCVIGYTPTYFWIPKPSQFNPCIDMDECQTRGVCGLDTICSNNPGSYYCTCVDGYYSNTGLMWKIGFSKCETISYQVVHSNSPYNPSLSASNNTMDINLRALARQNNGTASVVLMTVSGMESILSASYLPTENNTEMFSDIITATLPRINHTNLSEPVNFTIRHKRSFSESGLMTCVYWEQNGTDVEQARWSVDGCWVTYSDENYTVCSCSHLSTFALIMQTGKPDSADDPFLDLVNKVCVVVGLVFLALAILTFLLCNWNPKINNTARLHLCICLFLSQLFLLLNNAFIGSKPLCSVMAGLLHFLVVASFMWMLLEALQLYLLVRSLSKIQVIQRDGLRKKYLYLVGYGVPLVIVAVSVAVRPNGYGGTTVCWLKPDKNFTWALLGPVCVILAMNWIVFCVTIWSLRPTLANMRSDVSQSKDTRLIIFKILAQFVVLGCSWVLGLFQSTMVFKYLFILLNSQQGTFLYIVHCLFNKEVRDEYRKWLGCSTNKALVKDSMKATPTVSEDLHNADEQKKGTT
ncbi:hypothetical protein DPEC_G00307020 [Dallia pectoralis]|uniref:Uncharacterized protein n=1 Tax=Dallia pectoralis TaxID=75939 RepID=A0ACC2FEA8_DALPE|nr:hypothetical protein DPEC_G00307020 [Dallia pectoralis]